MFSFVSLTEKGFSEIESLFDTETKIIGSQLVSQANQSLFQKEEEANLCGGNSQLSYGFMWLCNTTCIWCKKRVSSVGVGSGKLLLGYTVVQLSLLIVSLV